MANRKTVLAAILALLAGAGGLFLWHRSLTASPPPVPPPVVAARPPAATPSAVADRALSIYARPQRLVRLPDGRQVHLFCLGRGSPTVILDAGFGWALSWAGIQPAIARTTRACTWDLPGWGYSDPSPLPQDADHRARDLEAVLKAGGIAPPYVLVGHAIGSFETRLFADRHPGEVAGMVLLDGNIEFQDERMKRVAPDLNRNQDHTATATYCATWLRAGKIDPRAAAYETCIGTPDPRYPPDLQAALLKMRLRPTLSEAAVSALKGVPASSQQLVRARRSFGAMPLIVLTSMRQLPPLPPELATQGAQAEGEWQQIQHELAALSTRGVQRRVPNHGRNILEDQPDAVIAAVKQARGR